MEDKKSGGGLLKWVIIALLLWFAYDNLLAKHWTVNWELKTFNVSDNQWFLDEDAPKFKDKQQCITYAANMSALSEAIRYDCGYKCKYDSSGLLEDCKDY